MQPVPRPAASPAAAHRHRAPVLTCCVLLPTAALSVVGLVVPAVERALRRDGAAIGHGQAWRLATGLLVQDGGVAGTVLNLLGLAIIGVLAERLLSRPRWAIGYAGGAVAGELAGWAGWQPVGAGNSVAVCGLSAVLAVALWRDARRRDRPGSDRAGNDRPGNDRAGPRWPAAAGAAAVITWSTLLTVTEWTSSVIIVAGTVAALSVVINLTARAGGGRLGLLAAPAVALAAAALLAAADIHGAALAAGLILGIALASIPRRTIRPAKSGTPGRG
jgi:hypothetical protein